MSSPWKESHQACSPVHPSSPTIQNNQISHKFPIKHTISRITYHSSITTNTLRTNPGVSIMVRFGQCAYSALSTIGLGETAVLVIFKSASVRDFIMSAIVDAETTGLPYSSESSSCIIFFTQHSKSFFQNYMN